MNDRARRATTLVPRRRGLASAFALSVRRSGRVALASSVLMVSCITGCNAKYVHECNAIKRTIDPLVASIDAKPRPRGVLRLRAFIEGRAKDYGELASTLEQIPVDTQELATSLQAYADAARRYAEVANEYLAALDEHSPEQVEAARRRAASEHETMVAASRSISGWCKPFGP